MIFFRFYKKHSLLVFLTFPISMWKSSALPNKYKQSMRLSVSDSNNYKKILTVKLDTECAVY